MGAAPPLLPSPPSTAAWTTAHRQEGDGTRVSVGAASDIGGMWLGATAYAGLLGCAELVPAPAGDSGGGDALVVSSDFFLSSEMGKEMSRLFKQVGPTDLGQCAKVNQ